MSTPSLRTASSGPVPWGVALAAGSLLLIGGGTLIWSSRDRNPDAEIPPSAEPGPVGEVRIDRRALPMPSADLAIHSIVYGVEKGTAVVKIKVTATGDELVVDASTGRLLETRPNRLTAPPPMGKFVAPFDPMT